MKRRQFIAGVGSAVAWPLAARAQDRTPVIGLLNGATLAPYNQFVAAFKDGLAAGGYVEGRNVKIEYRWAENKYDRLPALAADLVRMGVDLIATSPNSQIALAAKAATQSIPIVFVIGADPIETGLVASLSHPGGNITGVTNLSGELLVKNLDLLLKLVPTAKVITLLLNPANVAGTRSPLRDVQAAADKLGLHVQVMNASTESDIEQVFEVLAREHSDALLLSIDPFFVSHRVQLVASAARLGIPTFYSRRDFVEAGGLISYSANIASSYRRVGVYASRILKGDKPASLPVEQPTEFQLVINLKTARMLGLEIPVGVLAIADEVIE
jgi:putative tryptophan/tyrosine transport system substrate-binding protein